MEDPKCKFCSLTTFYVGNGRPEERGYWWCAECGAIGHHRPDLDRTSWFPSEQFRQKQAEPPKEKQPNVTKSLVRALKSLK